MPPLNRLLKLAAPGFVLVLAVITFAGAPTAAAPLAGPAAPQAVDGPALFEDLQWRNIGPANMAGRVTDIEAVEDDFTTVYVGAASGGVWKSTNAGTTWTPIFEDYGTANIGDIAVFQPDPDIVWVGTGESCVRNSVGWGDGVYKSVDGGETFINVGLADTQHIGQVLTHPTDPDIVYVAAQGHLWAYGGERGLFKTVDGGTTWEKLTNGLPDDGRTGATDLVMDPRDPEVLYVAMWQRLRQPHRFDSGGPDSGIYKSTDGGASWRRLTDGLPEGDIGKVGLAIARSNPDVVMAIVEHGFQPAERIEGDEINEVTGRPVMVANPDYDDMSKLGTGIYRSEDGGRSWEFVNRYNYRPFYYSHIYINPQDDEVVYVLTGSGQISVNGGRTFARSMDGISGDFHALWSNPSDPEIFYVSNDKGAYVTYDDGETFIMFDNMDVGQFYAVTADMRDPYYVYGGLQDNGNWGGPSNSRDYNGILNDHWFKFHSGDGFHTTVDPDDWRTVYTESQGGNIRRLDAVFRQEGTGITPDQESVLNVDEFLPEQEDSEDERQAFGGFGGNGLPREQFRFNWSTPLILSPHRSTTLYYGGNHVFKSTDRGDTWRIISPDLSYNDPETTDPESGGLTRDVTGAETHATVITLAESPIQPGTLWAGTDDGRVQLTRDDGGEWTDLRPNIAGVPRGLWVSRVVASHFAEGRAYVTFDGHRSDNFDAWVFRTDDYGATWTNIGAGLPAKPVYVIAEDGHNPDLLFVGNELGVWGTVDGGRAWTRLDNGLPTVPVYDLIIHPREGDLIAATHGRSVWILDDISALQQLDAEVLASDAWLFDSKVATQWRGISRGATRGHKLFMGRNPLTIQQRSPGNSPSELSNSAAIHFFVRDPEEVTLTISEVDGEQQFETTIDAHAGINRYFWPMRFPPSDNGGQGAGGRGGRGGRGFGRGAQGAAAEPGTYLVRITVGDDTLTSTLRVRSDPDAGAIE
ncbi:MAG: hypothetical protein PVJ51_04800 [Acidobacteriota bacterium]|jgi:hypothetical protein